ncbi:MAG: bifunctional phosphoribosylaminoimidazolecarboxamide formyltransferase/IMP cyclohydrolase [Bacteroidetes bacterium]|nr:bifunctional phosphoribosylaminoimidazolecarboxamide formyltransferase/IMP cyclohydrolase [Bacteroidota bacterium]
MSSTKKIKSALVSVYHKDGLEPIIIQMQKLGITIYSTGGTSQYIQSLQVDVIDVSTLTGFPEVFGGRVKTLHPTVFGGILHRRDNAEDIQQAAQHQIPPIDMVIVDLYPFEQTAASNATHDDIIEKIDVGGIALIRGAAKNYKDVVIIPSQSDYQEALTILSDQQGDSNLVQRKALAGKSFAITSHYDAAICKWFDKQDDFFKSSQLQSRTLRYGENPHQQGKYFGDLSQLFTQVHGKEISYNNLLDIDAAFNYISEFSAPAVAIIKHNNACGIATSADIKSAYINALAGDPVSAFGGIVIANRNIDAAVAAEMNILFMEILIAPAIDIDALELIKSKKNRIVLLAKEFKKPTSQFRSLLNGVIWQQADNGNEIQASATWNTVTVTKPTPSQMADLIFANQVCKNHKSNAIVLARNGQLLGSGCGMTSRVDALRHAISKAAEFGHSLQGAVMASDAFFPFPDCVEIAHQAGIVAVVQPGGSIKDSDSIQYCNTQNLSMVITGQRHFKH